MNKNISVIGGDLRIVKLVNLLQVEGFNILTFGLEKSDEIKQEQKADSIKECLNYSNIIISSVPFSKDGENVNASYSNEDIQIKQLVDEIKNLKNEPLFIAGGIGKKVVDDLEKKARIIDLLEDEPLTIMNAIPSAEGAIQVAMQESPKTLHGSNVLILGFGRIGKILAKMLNGIGAKVYCEARKPQDIAWIEAYGYKAIQLQNLNENLNKFNFIFNTIPYVVLNKPQLDLVKPNCIIIDLASKPGGVDFEYAKKIGIKTNWALGLPRKSCPRSSS